MKKYTSELLAKIRGTAPLVHNITNYVVMQSSANILLAQGASPVMAHAQEEVEEMSSIASALVLNIGTLQPYWIEAMILAAKTANKRNIPVILDPVGSGATRLRTETVKRILTETKVSVLRGNASEIQSLLSGSVKTKGVDSSTGIDRLPEMRDLAAGMGLIVAVSGPVDYITDGRTEYRIHNGHPIMTKVTGLGCGLSATVGAFTSIADGDNLRATAAAFGYYGLCGQLAAQDNPMPGSFAVSFIDRLASTGCLEIDKELKIAVR
mgnify:CR=1 FL=1